MSERFKCMSKDHPECREGEVFLGNFTLQDARSIGFKTKRSGLLAYCVDGKPYPSQKERGVLPYFAKISEVKNGSGIAQKMAELGQKLPWKFDTLEHLMAVCSVDGEYPADARADATLATWIVTAPDGVRMTVRTQRMYAKDGMECCALIGFHPTNKKEPGLFCAVASSGYQLIDIVDSTMYMCATVKAVDLQNLEWELECEYSPNDDIPNWRIVSEKLDDVESFEERAAKLAVDGHKIKSIMINKGCVLVDGVWIVPLEMAKQCVDWRYFSNGAIVLTKNSAGRYSVRRYHQKKGLVRIDGEWCENVDQNIAMALAAHIIAM